MKFAIVALLGLTASAIKLRKPDMGDVPQEVKDTAEDLGVDEGDLEGDEDDWAEWAEEQWTRVAGDDGLISKEEAAAELADWGLTEDEIADLEGAWDDMTGEDGKLSPEEAEDAVMGALGWDECEECGGEEGDEGCWLEDAWDEATGGDGKLSKEDAAAIVADWGLTDEEKAVADEIFDGIAGTDGQIDAQEALDALEEWWGEEEEEIEE